MTRDDGGIVVEHALQIVESLQGEGSLVVLQEGGYHHLGIVAPGTHTLVEDVGLRLAAQSECHAFYLLVLAEGEGYVFHELALVVLEGECHRYAAAHHALAHRVERELRVAQQSCLSVVEQLLVHLQSVGREAVVHAVILPGLDGVHHAVHDSGELFLVVHLAQRFQVGSRFRLHRFLEFFPGFVGYRRFLVEVADVYGCVLERCTLEELHHAFQLLVYLALVGVFIFVFQLQAVHVNAWAQFHDSHAVFGTVEVAPGLTVEVGVVDAGHRFSLVFDEEIDVVAVFAGYLGR